MRSVEIKIGGFIIESWPEFACLLLYDEPQSPFYRKIKRFQTARTLQFEFAAEPKLNIKNSP